MRVQEEYQHQLEFFHEGSSSGDTQGGGGGHKLGQDSNTTTTTGAGRGKGKARSARDMARFPGQGSALGDGGDEEEKKRRRRAKTAPSRGRGAVRHVLYTQRGCSIVW